MEDTKNINEINLTNVKTENATNVSIEHLSMLLTNWKYLWQSYPKNTHSEEINLVTYYVNEVFPTASEDIQIQIAKLLGCLKFDPQVIRLTSKLLQEQLDKARATPCNFQVANTLVLSLQCLGKNQHLAADALLHACQVDIPKAIDTLAWNISWILNDACNQHIESTEKLDYASVTIHQLVTLAQLTICDKYMERHNSLIKSLKKTVPEGPFKQELRNHNILPPFELPSIKERDCKVEHIPLGAPSMGEFYNNEFKRNGAHRNKTCACYCKCPKHVNTICSSILSS